MRFTLIDKVLEQDADRIVAIKQLTSAEEYLQDHFATFPVMPGVLMLEAMVQAARRLVPVEPGIPPMVLGEVKALKYGHFVRPGETLRVEVERQSADNDAIWFKGKGLVLGTAHPTPPVAVSGRLLLRAPRVGALRADG